MGATKNEFNSIREYYAQKYDFISNEILYQTLDCDIRPKDNE